MSLKMSHLFFSTALLLIYFTPDALAQARGIFNSQVAFNNSDIDYPKDILFWLYTRENGNDSQTLFVGDESSLKQSSYRTSRQTKFVTHGWVSTGMDPICVEIRLGFLLHGDYNMIVVDWSAVSKSRYFYASSRVRAIGKYIAEMVQFLADQGSDVKQMSLVGHSLGAHVMGLAGYEMLIKVGHVVGLDPAGPGFNANDEDERISIESADRVEIVHTDGNLKGMDHSIGHIDYWPNGGNKQPGCGSDVTGTCAHSRAYQYYAESLKNPDAWYAVKCDSYSDFKAGICDGHPIEPFPRWAPVPDNPDGVYMLRTNDASPFGLGIKGAEPPPNWFMRLKNYVASLLGIF